MLGITLALTIFGVFFSRKYRSERGTALSRFPLVVSSCIFMEAIFGLLKINASMNTLGDDPWTAWGFYVALDQFFFYLSFWIFALKYHEISAELKIMLNSEITNLLE